MSSLYVCFNPGNVYSRLISFKTISFTLNSSTNKKIMQHKNHKESSAEYKPQNKLISITTVQGNEFLVATQRYLWVARHRVVSCESIILRANELWVYHIMSCKPTSLWVIDQQAYGFPAFKLTICKASSQSMIQIWYIKKMSGFLWILYSKILHDFIVRNFCYLHVLVWFLIYSCHLLKQYFDSYLKLMSN